MNKPSDETIKAMVDLYDSGNQIMHVAKKFGYSTGKTYYILRDAGCKFRPKRVGPHSEETKKKISATHKGKIVSGATRQKQSESRKCHFNGLNGYGHTKSHCRGYELVYAPDHPKAHKDGYVMKHTVVAEQTIGRYLYDNEEVHHINHIRNDNRPENLVVIDSHKHRSMHMKERIEKRRNDLSIR